MELVSLVGMAALALSAADPGGPSPGVAASSPLPRPVFTRQTLFSIPFEVAPPGPAGQEAVEVRLYVSADRGATWHFYSKVEPSRGYFLFRAGGDDALWFLIRTVDRDGQLRPDGASGPGLIVVVDTIPPRLALEARRGAGGEVTAMWQIEDPNFDRESLRIQYRTAVSPVWESVAVNHDDATRAGAVHHGTVTWWLPPNVPGVQIRAEVSDMAGNPSVTHAQLGAESPPVTAPGSGTSSAVEQPAARRTVPDPAEPPSEVVRWVPGIFELDYDVESAGSLGIDRVELWGTRDGGQTWSSFGIDDDNKSPMLVTVHEDGIYGFRVVVRNGAGLGGKMPRAGDKPEVWIGVDQTRPSAQILNTEQTGGSEAGQLLIKWKADDPMLANRPISLLVSDSPGGPWSPVATDLENSGEYLWPLDGRARERIYLRLEARDRAGNLGVDETSTAISGRQLQPVVRIRDVRPLDRASQLPQRSFLR